MIPNVTATLRLMLVFTLVKPDGPVWNTKDLDYGPFNSRTSNICSFSAYLGCESVSGVCWRLIQQRPVV